MAGSQEQNGDSADKWKHPFQELKEKLKDSHLHDAKISLIHTKYVHILRNEDFPTQHVDFALDIKSANSQIS